MLDKTSTPTKSKKSPSISLSAARIQTKNQYMVPKIKCNNSPDRIVGQPLKMLSMFGVIRR